MSANRKLKVIGELINNSYGRARKAWENRDIERYQNLARTQAERGVDYLTLNIDGTQHISVQMEEMLEFLPRLIPAIQEATPVPISFDNPSILFHEVALRHYDRSKSARPIINSLAASRERLDDMIALVKEFDTLAIVMASEKFVERGGAQCLDPQDAYETTKRFVDLLVTKADRALDQIIIDPGLAPVGADTYGLVNIGLDAMALIHADPDLQGVHISVGLSNFAWGTPKRLREQLERSYLTLATDRGLDFALANPEKDLTPLDPGDPMVEHLRRALEQGRARNGESQEDAGFRQADSIMELCAEIED